MHAEIHPILANLADQRLWCLAGMAVCCLAAIAVTTLFALFRIPRGLRGAFLSRVQSDVTVALFASLWSSLLLAGCIFVLFAGAAWVFPFLERQTVLWFFVPIWAICYVVIASVRIRDVFRATLAPPDDTPWVVAESDDEALPSKRKRKSPSPPGSGRASGAGR